MEWIKNLKIDKKLTVLITIGLILGAVIGFIGIGAINVCKSSESLLINLGIKPEELIANTYQMVQANRADTYKYVLSSNATERAEIKSNMLKRYDTIAENVEEYSKKDNEAKTKNDMEDMANKVAECKKLRLKVLDLKDQGKPSEAFALIKINAKNAQAILDSLDNLDKEVRNQTSELENDFNKAATSAITFLIITMLVTIAVLSILGKMISNMITKPIQHAIGELTKGSSEVSAASAQVEAASHALAEGTQEQSASIQETSSTLEETASMVQQNNENTKQAAIMAKNAKEYAQKSNKEMSTMMVSMGDLKQSSNEIAKIIKVIDEIAFQTNLLSLNAAVEAARAGDAGKGFAVVAEEVRSLAQRSAQAAKDTASIIEKNISLSEGSADIAKNVNESLTQIDEEAKKVAELLEEISTATDEQARGISEINKAVQQMEQVVEENAATSEESASAAQELSSQAENVGDIVRSLIRLVEGANAANTNGQTTRNYQVNRVSVDSKKAIPQHRHPENIIPLNEF